MRKLQILAKAKKSAKKEKRNRAPMAASLRSEHDESAVEMTPRGKRGKLKKRVFHAFSPGLEIRQKAPDFHISTAPTTGRSSQGKGKQKMKPKSNSG